jgi:hypothetical protein
LGWVELFTFGLIQIRCYCPPACRYQCCGAEQNETYEIFLLSMTKQITTTTDDNPLKGWKKQFIQVLQKVPNVRKAAEVAGVSRSKAYAAREDDELFDQEWTDAIDSSVDKLVARAFELAEAGDTGLITFLLRCHRPEYRDVQRHDVALLGNLIILPATKEGPE